MSKATIIEHLVREGKTVSWEKLAEIHDISSGEAARAIWKRYRMEVESVDDELTSELSELGNSGIIETLSNIERGTNDVKFVSSKESLTDTEIYNECKLDPSRWNLTQVLYRKSKDGFLYSANFKATTPNEIELINRTLSGYKTTYKPLKQGEFLQNLSRQGESCMMISLPDFHLDNNYNDGATIREHIRSYEIVLDNLIHKCYSSHRIDEILFVVSNDFYHTDNIHNSTTKGTPLRVSVEWDEAYELGFDLMVRSISKLRQFCNKLTIMSVLGNHSTTKEFYLAHGLEVYFKTDPNIIFNRSKDGLKVFKYGETLLCFSHGNNVNDRLPLVFATSFYKEWGLCRYKEIILGDKHHTSEKIIRFQGEANGVKMRILPAMCKTDQWHKDNLFIGSLQGGIAIIYDKTQGKVAEFESRV